MSAPDVWVGSWRPHRPRGPIAALYSSPGPKYALPGTVGIQLHDPRKLKYPAFSFGTRHQQLRSDGSPGPGYLVASNITRLGRDGTPSYSLYSRPKEPRLFQTPGPGRYSPEKAVNFTACSSPAYSLSARTKGFRHDQTPGPAAYMLPAVLGPSTVNKTAAPNFTLKGRTMVGSFYEDHQKSPGPGTYRVVDTNIYKMNSPHYSMIGRNSMPGDTSQKPGPGAHRPEQVTFTSRKAPSFSFGIRHSEFTAPLIAATAEHE
ncbi:ciliary microtubule associated protein 1B [Denticeps clupeoides]|uniref:ciliary microtubule associated protein 1B n=1 Tax=Denticeps clupeoides TaxID=299321 RepID=UPI0010A42D3A|nr:outer dense fiber protein 3-B-like [Denticeps clupeoides]XP_028813421.1 outer dense fiber protein 3-B-like [Denticeps clupeoides]